MLKELRIDNFVLIDSAKIEFNSGFTVITGETGSGKSILLNALNLLLGERADYAVIGPKKDKSIVEGEINIQHFDLKDFFAQNDIDYSSPIIIRREISKEGRSRAFVNDCLVQLATLRELGSRLIHIHSQYNTLELKNADYQLELIDILAGTILKRDEFSRSFKALQAEKQELERIQQQLVDAERDKDYVTFQLNELNEIDLETADFQALEEQLKLLESGDELIALLDSIADLNMNETSPLAALNDLKSKLSRKKGVSARIDELIERFEQASSELVELTNDAANERANIELDPIEKDRIALLVDAYNRLLFKYKMKDQAELLDLKRSLQEQSSDVSGMEERLVTLTSSIEKGKENLRVKGDEIHQLRTKAIERIENELKEELNLLKLPNCSLRFKLTRADEPKQTGFDSVSFLFSPNSGMEPVPIQKAASGGELSRVMLALQYLVSQHTQLQTVLFDEIDTGVSGDVAARIGDTLRKMGDSMQIIAITHLPQVAGKGAAHLQVEKIENAEGRSTTRVRALSPDERIDEIARLMSGDVITDGARSNAKTLLFS